MAERVEERVKPLLDELVESAVYAVFGDGEDESDWARLDRAAVESRLRDYLARDFRCTEARTLVAEARVESVKSVAARAVQAAEAKVEVLNEEFDRVAARVEELERAVPLIARTVHQFGPDGRLAKARAALNREERDNG